MPNAFDSPRRKIDWAQHHIRKVKRVIQRFYREKDLYAVFTEPHPNIPQRLVCKMRLTKQPPWFLDDIVADAVTNLRSALDHAMFAVSSAAGKKERFRHATFPFGYTKKSFEDSLGGNCSDVPPEIFPLIRGYDPYKRPESGLWALHSLRCTNEHALVVPVGSAVYAGGNTVEGIGGFVSMPYKYTWDRTKGEMELCTIGPGVKLQGNFKFACCIEFGEIDAVVGQAVVPTLDLFADMVTTIVDEIEAETRRLGFTADL